MEMADGSLGEHGIRHESLLLFLSPPQSRVMFRAKGEGHGWSLLFLHHKAFLYIEDIMVVVFAYSSNFPPFCILNFFKRQRRGGRGGWKEGCDGQSSQPEEEGNPHLQSSPPRSSSSCYRSSLISWTVLVLTHPSSSSPPLPPALEGKTRKLKEMVTSFCSSSSSYNSF